MEQVIKITTKALICKDDMILLAKDEKGKWEMPGGKLEFGESPENSLLRELTEELSVSNSKIGKLLDVWSFIVEKIDRKIQYVVLVYEVIMNDAQVIRSDEHVAVEWIEKDKIQNLEMRDGYKKTISKFFGN